MTLQEIVAGNFEAQTDFLKALVRVPSDNPPGDMRPHSEEAARLIEALGFPVARHPVPDALARQFGMISVQNLIVRLVFGDGCGPTIALNAHGDVVPPGEGWTFDPYGAIESDGAIYGRGAAVSKSDFATYVFAAMALRDSDLPLDGTIELHLTYDEEVGGELGPKWLIDQGLTKPDLAISAGFSYAVVTAHNGCLHLEVSVRGRQAHAAMPESGADALEGATTILNALYAERARLSGIRSDSPGIGSPKINVGLISGGINTNVVPDRIVLRLDRRIIPGEDAEIVEADLIGLIESAVRMRPEIGVECRRILLAEPLRPRPEAEKLAETIANHAWTVFGVDVPMSGVPLYTDARHYSAAGVPTVLYGAGPRSILEANAHAADERVRLDDLRGATQTIALTLAELLRR